MRNGACRRLLGVHFVDKAGHSIPEEQPEQVNRLLIEFLHRTRMART
jgi:pimeloyl-ACP methyl ester carboxylesterase